MKNKKKSCESHAILILLLTNDIDADANQISINFNFYLTIITTQIKISRKLNICKVKKNMHNVIWGLLQNNIKVISCINYFSSYD